MIILTYQDAPKKQSKLISKLKTTCAAIFRKAELVYLFGSFAKGTNTVLSDIDFAFLFDSRYDKHELFEIRLDLISSLQKLMTEEVDVVILNLAPPLLKFEAINGILLHEKNRATKVAFEVKTINEYLDTKYLRKVQSQYLFKRISEYDI